MEQFVVMESQICIVTPLSKEQMEVCCQDNNGDGNEEKQTFLLLERPR